MAWFLNHYHCNDCDTEWDDEWSCVCDDECPNCRSRNWSPQDSEDLTFVLEDKGVMFAVLHSPDFAGHSPEYVEVAEFTSEHSAELYIEAVLRPQTV